MTKELVAVDHESEGSDKILSQYKNSPIFDVTLDTFTAKINELEDQFTKFKTELTLDTALGVNLDLIGDILNSPIRPIDDEDYRKVLNALVVAYNSDGRASDILSLMNGIMSFDDINIIDYGIASFGVQVFNPVLPLDVDFIVGAVDIAKSAGVLFEGLVVVPDTSPLFSFFEDDDPNSGGFKLGTPEVDDGSAGYLSIILT
jgi:hypothetical protein